MEQPGFTRLAVQGYRRLADVSIDFTGRPLAVIVGANGAGKTSLLKVFELLLAGAKGNLRAHLAADGGLSEILTRNGANQLSVQVAGNFVFDSPTQQANEDLSYLLAIARFGIGYVISAEVLRPADGSNERFLSSEQQYFRYSEAGLIRSDAPINVKREPLESALSQFGRNFPKAEAVQRRLTQVASYKAIDVSERGPIRLPQTVAPVSLPQADGDDTVAVLYNLRESDPDRFEVVEDTLRAVFPSFRGLTFPPVAAGKVTMTWLDADFSKPFYVNELSEGTLRFLWLCAILYSPELPEIVLIDEPEVSMHPTMLRMLAEMLKEASQRSQILVATHSDRLVSFLEPRHLLVADINDEGMAEFTWADQKENLELWLKDYSLGELWNMNVFGGRP